jgi:hypothetical protein
VNPRRRRRSPKRRRNPPTARAANPRRRRRRYYGAASRRRNPSKRRGGRRRRRNPSSYGYSSMSSRTANPDVFDIDQVMDIMPAATGGIFAVRWGMKLAGPFEVETSKNAQGADVQVAVPGIKHAIAGLIAAKFGASLVAQIAGGGPEKEKYALIAGLGFVGDVFARKRLLADNEWAQNNLMLQGVDDCDGMSGLQETSQLGADDFDYYEDEEGNIYQLPAGSSVDDLMSGLQETSQLGGNSPRGMAGAGKRSTFGY